MSTSSHEKLHNKVILHLIRLKFPSALDSGGPGLKRLLGEECDDTVFASWREEHNDDDPISEFAVDGTDPSLWRQAFKDYYNSIDMEFEVVYVHIVNDLSEHYEDNLFEGVDVFDDANVLIDWQDFAGWTVGLNLAKCCRYLPRMSKTDILESLMPQRTALFEEELENKHIKARDYYFEYQKWEKRIGLKKVGKHTNADGIEVSEVNMICAMLLAVVIDKYNYEPFAERDNGAIAQISKAIELLQENYSGKLKGKDRKTIKRYLDIACSKLDLKIAGI